MNDKLIRAILGGLLGTLIGMIVGYFLFSNYMGFQFSIKTVLFGFNSNNSSGVLNLIFNTAGKIANEYILKEIRQKILLCGLFSGVLGLFLGIVITKNK